MCDEREVDKRDAYDGAVMPDAERADEAAAEPALRIVRRTIPSIPPALEALSGSYRAHANGYVLDMLLDLYAQRPRLSIDFQRSDGAPVGWCFVRSAALECSNDKVEVKGMGRFSFSAEAPLVTLSITRHARGGPSAELAFMSVSLKPGARYACAYVGAFPRRLAEPGATILPFPPKAPRCECAPG